MSQFTDYLASVDGVALDVDGNYGPQCWDLWSHYATNLIGVDPWWLTGTNSGGGCPYHSGYTCGIWIGFGSNLNPWFTQVSGPPQRGDVAIWDYGSAPAPLSHVAIVVEDRGDSVLTMTQNPGACHYGQISKSGILGYLRPDNQSFFDGGAGPAPTPSPSGNTHTVIPGDTLWGISEKFYGTGYEWPRIYEANSAQIANPNLIFPGQIFLIP